MPPRVLTTTQSNAVTLTDTEGQPYPVAPAGGGNGPGVLPPLYSVVLRPGDTSGADNVFTTWGALYAACSSIAGGVLVTFDDSHVSPIPIPAGAYNIEGWLFKGAPNPATTSGGASIAIATGVTFGGGLLSLDQVDVSFAGAAALMTSNAGTPEVNVATSNGATIVCTGAGAFATAVVGGFLFVICHDSGVLGDGTHAVFSSSGGGSAFVLGFNGTDPKADAFAGASTTYDYDASSAPNLPQGAGVTLRQLDAAANMSYAPAVVANWSGTAPTSVANALDRIAAHVGPIP